MSFLKTEIVSDRPRVLIISTENIIAGKIQEEFLLKKIETVVVSLDQYIHNKEIFTNQVFFYYWF